MAIEQIIKPQVENLGAIPIRRILPSQNRMMVGPFIFMDQGGPLDLPSGAGGVPEHPHAGLSTFTYLISGSVFHRDSAGNVQTVNSGDIALMNAGSGITHEELASSDESSQTREVYFCQMWLALPDDKEDMPPSLEHYSAAELPYVKEEGASVKLLMGTGWNQTAPTTCFIDTIFADIEVEAGKSLSIENSSEERAIFLLEGDGAIDGVDLELHNLVILGSGDRPQLSSKNGCRAILLGGAKFPSQRYIAGSFVASSQDKIRYWMREYQTGQFPRIKR